MIGRLVLALAESDRPLCQRAADRTVLQLLRWFLSPIFLPDPSDHRNLDDHLEACRLPTPRLAPGWTPLPVDTGPSIMPLALRGSEDWNDRLDEPLVLFHHGAGEFPVERGLARALAAGPLAAPWLLVRAAGHQSRQHYQRLMRSATGALAMFASSVAAIEAVLRATAPRPVVLTGISLGGMIVLLHAVRYGAAWADRPITWLPVDAGPDFIHVLTRGGFARLADGRLSPALVADRIGRPIHDLPTDRVRPLLGLWDQLHCPGVHRRAYADLGIRPRWAPRGHMGLALDGPLLRRVWNEELQRLTA